LTDTTPEAPTEGTEAPSRDALIRKAYASAARALREAHKEEFLDLQEKFAADLGVDWKRPEDAEEKAAKQIEALLSEYPGLASRFTSTEDEDAEGESAEDEPA